MATVVMRASSFCSEEPRFCLRAMPSRLNRRGSSDWGYLRRGGERLELLELAHAQVKTARDMEAALPFSALQREEHIALAVEISEPFSKLGIRKMFPGVGVQPLEPVGARGLPGESHALKEGDQGLDMHPPELLVPFELLRRAPGGVFYFLVAPVRPPPHLEWD